MLLGSGVPQEVAVWKLGAVSFRRAGTQLVNGARRRAWREGCDCVWRENGVWDFDAAGAPRLLRPNHFSEVRSTRVDFGRDYLQPFARRFTAAIRAVDPRALIFLEPEPGHLGPPWSAEDTGDVAFAPHWYDGHVLMSKQFSPLLAANAHTRKPVFLRGPIRRSFAQQLANIRQGGQRAGMPVLLAEFGIPFDLNHGRAFSTGDFSAQIKALDRSFRAVEDNLLSCTLWNYTADNTNARGDGWNGEDFSIFSRDQRDEPGDINSGGRALDAVVRPYPRAIAGVPLRLSFDVKRRVFEFEFRHDPALTAPTEIFVPRLQYGQGFRVEVSDGSVEIDLPRQLVIYRHDAEHRGAKPGEHWMRITPAGAQ